MGRVEGKVAIVTGGASGIGAASALRLGAEGAKVVVTDIQDGPGEDVAGSIRNAGGEAMFIHHDVADEAAWQAVVDKTMETYGRLDILFDNAGFAVIGPATDLSLEDWRRQMAVNVDGVFLGVKYAVPAMRKSGGGSIIITSSVAGLIGAPGGSAYSTSKGAVRLFAKSMALEYATENIRVNSVHPGMIETPIWQGMAKQMTGAELDKASLKAMLEERMAGRVPMGKLGTPEQVANGVLFLASDESDYITGTELVIDGGIMAQ